MSLAKENYNQNSIKELKISIMKRDYKEILEVNKRGLWGKKASNENTKRWWKVDLYSS